AHVTDRLIAKLSQARAIPYLDMPIQHADDAILRSMRRGVTRRRMAEIVARLRAAIPGATLRTTVLVGFPGETDAAFETPLDFLDEMRFDRVGTFVSSAEDGTPAAALPDPVPADVANERARVVQESQDRLAWERHAALQGSIHEVLIDGPSQDPAFAWEGRMAAQTPEIDGVVYLRERRLSPGRRIPVEIVEVDGYDLVGIPVGC